jgi:hypothetical protein
MNGRAVSNLLGYTLMFGIILTATVTVSVIAVDQLETVRENEQLNNAERGFFLVGQNINEIQDNRAAVRSGELDLNDGNIGISSGSNIRIQIDDVSGPTDDYEETLPMRALVYGLEDSRVAYESSAIFRGDNDNVVTQQGPNFVCTDDTAIVSVVTLQGRTGRQLGSGTVGVRATERTSRLRFPQNQRGTNSMQGESTVTIDVGGAQFTDGWVRSLEEDDNGWERVGSTTQFQCENVDTYYVRQTVVDIAFTR